jgi:hypothetical protein
MVAIRARRGEAEGYSAANVVARNGTLAGERWDVFGSCGQRICGEPVGQQRT